MKSDAEAASSELGVGALTHVGLRLDVHAYVWWCPARRRAVVFAGRLFWVSFQWPLKRLYTGSRFRPTAVLILSFPVGGDLPLGVRAAVKGSFRRRDSHLSAGMAVSLLRFLFLAAATQTY